MYKENGFAYQILVLIVIIVIAISGVIINKIIGKDGVVERVVTVENNFSKEDVLEKIDFMITQKFIELNNQAKENNKVISEIYSSDVILEYLKQASIIEDVYDENGNIIENVYLINVDKLYENSVSKLTQSGTFNLEKIDNSYVVTYTNSNNEKENIGELHIQQV